MADEIMRVGDVEILVQRKAVKYLRLGVSGPEGRVRLSVPLRASSAEARAFVEANLDWIRNRRQRVRARAAQEDIWATPKRFVDGETVWLWGRRHCLRTASGASAFVHLDAARREVALVLPPGAGEQVRAALLARWYEILAQEAIAPLIARWEPRLGVRVTGFTLRWMKTRWGSCTRATGRIRFNPELVKRPPEALEYVVVHELAHLLEANHSPRFYAILDQHLPDWRAMRAARDRPMEGA